MILALAALLCKFRSFACSRHGSLGRYFRSTDETAGAKFAHHDYHMYSSEACVATGAGIHTQARRHPRTAPALDTCSVLLAAVTSAGSPQQTARAVDVERAPGAGYQCARLLRKAWAGLCEGGRQLGLPLALGVGGAK